MSILPTILPADPAAPEGQQHKTRKLSYGLFGKLFLAYENASQNRIAKSLPHNLQRDIGLTDVDRPVTRASRSTWRADLDQCLSRPGFL